MNEMYFAQFWHKQKQQIVKAVKYVGKRSGCICSLVCVTSYDRKGIINGVTTFFTFWLTTKWQKLNDKKTGLNRFEVDIVVVAEVDHLLIQIPRIVKGWAIKDWTVTIQIPTIGKSNPNILE